MSSVYKNVYYENWLDPTEEPSYFQYWNNPSKEESFDDFQKMEAHLSDIGLYKDLENILKYCKARNLKILGHGLDLAAGNLWATAYLLNNSNSIEKMLCLEFSKHRLLNLGPKLLNHYKVDKTKVQLILGNFYDLKLADESIDFVILSEALHHAGDPKKLLAQVYRVLKKNGVVILIGDLFISKTLYLKCFANYIISYAFFKIAPHVLKRKFNKFLEKKDFSINFRDLYFPPDQETGDHYFLRSEFHSFFKEFFWFKEFKSTKKNLLSFVLVKK
ncbi:class I SAM-dependent methyltransferase [Candidatus Nucleicultrix amoebiphila]|uniref:Methyltransferase type 11 domain-containing protein n=1 Tax=Candidatus Nucleicultrix amoebiphila FS5 TaxID=1414854 RepID=A0A1W6N592_9PROT|nr:class I SAM-dependent methyltransferase [Candidatus Nucleicultrix amoebiphila]ARN85050.1 hypothetical protein GQ61_06835 [Candidatus Nucleicultrix amoebiphila FS5]